MEQEGGYGDGGERAIGKGKSIRNAQEMKTFLHFQAPRNATRLGCIRREG